MSRSRRTALALLLAALSVPALALAPTTAPTAPEAVPGVRAPVVQAGAHSWRTVSVLPAKAHSWRTVSVLPAKAHSWRTVSVLPAKAHSWRAPDQVRVL